MQSKPLAEPSDRYAPPLAHVEDAAPDIGTLAGRGARLGAAIIDALLQFAIAWAGSRVLSYDIFGAASGQASVLAATITNGLIGVAVFVVLQGWLLVRRGQTLGKLALGLRIVRSDMSRVTPARVLGLRYGPIFGVNLIPIVGPLLGLLDCLLIFRGSRKCLHDSIAGTVVIKV